MLLLAMHGAHVYLLTCTPQRHRQLGAFHACAYVQQHREWQSQTWLCFCSPMA